MVSLLFLSHLPHFTYKETKACQWEGPGPKVPQRWSTVNRQELYLPSPCPALALGILKGKQTEDGSEDLPGKGCEGDDISRGLWSALGDEAGVSVMPTGKGTTFSLGQCWW